MFIAAVCLSAIAGYYSVVGMASIFSGSAVAVMLMTGTLEASKVIVASWLYNNWQKTPFLLRSYLTVAVVVLMLITSIGIFGYLSKAHIEQTLSAQSNFEQIEKIDEEITRQETTVSKLNAEILKLESKSVDSDSGVQQQIDREQIRIDSAYTRIQPAIDEQNSIIAQEEQRLAGSLTIYESQLRTIEQDLTNLQTYINNNDIEKLQALVSVKVDGDFGTNTQIAVDRFKADKAAEQQTLIESIANEKQQLVSPVIDAAREEIKRLRSLAETEIANSNELINRLRSQIGTVDTGDITAKISSIEQDITDATTAITALIEKKTTLETEYRKIEAEVGPIKFAAQMFYGETVTQNILEESVRYMILILIFVFDPLAMLMLIASNQGMREIRENWSKNRNANNNIAVGSKDPVSSTPVVNSTVIPENINVVDNKPLDTDENVLFTVTNESDTIDQKDESILEVETTNSPLVSDTDILLNTLKTAHETRLQQHKTSN